jgi:hypothetical protein
MPVKLPAPDLGTEEQPGPKSAVVAAGEEAAAAGAEEAGAEDAGVDAADEDPLELHAVAVRAKAARPQAASTRYFMVSPFKWAAVS